MGGPPWLEETMKSKQVLNWNEDRVSDWLISLVAPLIYVLKQQKIKATPETNKHYLKILVYVSGKPF